MFRVFYEYRALSFGVEALAHGRTVRVGRADGVEPPLFTIRLHLELNRRKVNRAAAKLDDVVPE